MSTPENKTVPEDAGPGMPPEGIPDLPVPDGVREITQSPYFDPEIDDEDEMREAGEDA